MAQSKHPNPPGVLLLSLHEASRAGALEYARKGGWLPILCGMANDPPEALADNWDVQAILCGYLPAGPDSAYLPLWRQTTVPTVMLSAEHTAVTDIPAVESDHAAVAATAAEHFLQRGFEHLAYCLMAPDPFLLEHAHGFRRSVERAGQTFHCLDWVATGQGRYAYPARFRLWLAEELAALPTPLALLVDSPWTALEAIEACRACGLLVPEQIAVIAVDEDPILCENAPLPISTIDTNRRAQGYAAAELLDRLIRAGRRWRKLAPRKPIRIPPGELIVRQSSDIVAVPHVEVAKAIRFIWGNYANPRLGVDDVVAATTLSRPGLYLAFHRHLGRSVVEEIRRVRLDRAMNLLAATTLTVKDIAATSGYRDEEHLRATLRRATRLSPRAWRKQHRKEDVAT
ncbi:MAG: substrate-binding domain-containing protein [Planctomycetaceae bacterium]|nr:substrate-binding domain-containing protein [Planctomycetaceae bacterium]